MSDFTIERVADETFETIQLRGVGEAGRAVAARLSGHPPSLVARIIDSSSPLVPNLVVVIADLRVCSKEDLQALCSDRAMSVAVVSVERESDCETLRKSFASILPVVVEPGAAMARMCDLLAANVAGVIAFGTANEVALAVDDVYAFLAREGGCLRWIHSGVAPDVTTAMTRVLARMPRRSRAAGMRVLVHVESSAASPALEMIAAMTAVKNRLRPSDIAGVASRCEEGCAVSLLF
jgi:hypothetical protein